MQYNAQIQQLIDLGALFVVNHSGGKDSQAMMIKLRDLVPHSQLLVVHAELPGADWEGTLEHAEASAGSLPFITCRAVKTFKQMVERRGMFPSPQYRQCTSDLKRGPIEKVIRGYVKSNPQYQGLIVNCVGIRAEESSARSKAQVFKFNKRNSKAGREWYDWLPIHDMKVGQVFATIAAAGEKPHWAYAAGMSRLSCCFCIMSSRADLIRAAQLVPDKYREYVELEKRVGHTMTMPRKDEQPRGLEAVTGIPVVIQYSLL